MDLEADPIPAEVEPEPIRFRPGWPAWTPADGPAPYVYASKPPGARCLWACRWQTGSGWLLPRDFYRVEDLTYEAAHAELSDLVEQPYFPQRARAVQMLEELERHKVWPVFSIEQALHQMRESYSEYIPPWDLPTGRVWMRDAWRPGWLPVKDVSDGAA